MGKTEKLTDDLAERIAAEAKQTIQNTFNTCGQIDKKVTLQELSMFGNDRPYEWISEVIKGIIDSAPMSKYQVVTGQPNFMLNISAELTQSQQKLTPDSVAFQINLYGKDEAMQNNIAACFYGGEVKVKDGVIAIDKEVTDAEKIGKDAAEKLAAYFVRRYEENHGKE